MIERFTCPCTLDRNQALRLAPRSGFAILCLDLDRFPAVNDTLGHPLRQEVSQRLLSCVRQGDLAVRLVGDALDVIQANARDASSEVLAARSIETVGKRHGIIASTSRPRSA